MSVLIDFGICELCLLTLGVFFIRLFGLGLALSFVCLFVCLFVIYSCILSSTIFTTHN